jgi:hypothetical protein
MRLSENSSETKRLVPLHTSPASETAPSVPACWLTLLTVRSISTRAAGGKAFRIVCWACSPLTTKPSTERRPRMSGNIVRKALNASPAA